MGWRISIGFVAALATLAGPVRAQETPASPGLPMWIIEDEDSKIYITGTVHLLRDQQQWRSDKLDAAFAEAHELWLEVVEIGDPERIRKVMHKFTETYGVHDGPPLTSMLDEKENALLAEARAKAGVSAEDAERMDRQQPWVTMFWLGRDNYFNGAYKEENGIDIAFARMARDRNMPIRGIELIDDQLDLILGFTIEEQLEELRSALRAPPGVRQRDELIADVAFGSWVRGETNSTEALVLLNRAAVPSYEAVFTERNIAWAGVVEEILAGSGVVFVAVGAGHLVGPDSLQKQLEGRGIQSRRY